MNKNMTLVSGCLLLFSTQLMADRPAMSEESTGPEMQESTAPAQPEAMPTEVISPLEKASQGKAQGKAMAPAPSPNKIATTTSTTQTGDTLELQSGETLPVQVLDFPRRGMSMDNVKKELGEPLEMTPAIGEPPISSWSYNDRTVYFERSRVIHAVSSH